MNRFLASRFEVLEEIAPAAQSLLDQHRQKYRAWSSSDHLPPEERGDGDASRSLARLRDRARDVPDAVRVALALNLITEEGLPHFHRLLDSHIGGDSPWREWNYRWTAEEDRHGNVLRDYLRDTALVDFRRLEKMQFEYLAAGFDPAWDRDPYRVFVFTTLQERATQISHQNSDGAARGREPVLRGILQNIAQDEARHYAFYREIVAELLRVDPEGMLDAAARIMPRIDMPGLNVPGFAEMGEVLRREGVYTPWHYKEIVEECLRHWRIAQLTGLSPAACKAQELLLTVPARLEKIAKYIEAKQGSKSFRFEVIGGRTLKYA